MSTAWSFLAAALVVSAAIICLGWCTPPSAVDAKRDALPTLPSALDERLEERRRILMQRVAGREDAVRDILAGRLTLAEAVALYRELFAPSPETCRMLQARMPGIPFEQVLRRQVIRDVETALEFGAVDPVGGVVARLNAELAALARAEGSVTLPQMAPVLSLD